MTVQELVDKLERFDPETPVRLFADHGQRAMPAYIIGKAKIEDTYMAEDIVWDGEFSNYDNYIEVVIISD